MNLICLSLFSIVLLGSSANLAPHKPESKEWMKHFPHHRLVDLRVIPGTHHSGIRHPRSITTNIIWGWIQCQRMVLSEQLENGVRFVDFRVHVDPLKEEVTLSHTFLSDTTLKSVLHDVANFLSSHPSESIIMYIRGDYHFGELDKQRSQILSKVIRDSHLQLWNVSNAENPLQSLTVGELAGKALLIAEKGSLSDEVPYLTRKVLQYQDIWRATSILEARRLVDSYMSKPYGHKGDVFGGVAIDGMFPIRQQRHTSPLMNSWFLDNVGKKWTERVKQKVGIIMIDFADRDSLRNLVELNFAS